MKTVLTRSELKGTIIAPPSKSYTIRGLMCAALARGESELVNPLLADDTEAAARVLSQIGAEIRRGDSSWKISGGAFHEPQQVQVSLGGQAVDQFTLQTAQRTLRKIPLAAARLGPGEMAELTIAVDKTFVPALLDPSNKDPRELGVRVFHAFVQPTDN